MVERSRARAPQLLRAFPPLLLAQPRADAPSDPPPDFACRSRSSSWAKVRPNPLGRALSHASADARARSQLSTVSTTRSWAHSRPTPPGTQHSDTLLRARSASSTPRPSSPVSALRRSPPGSPTAGAASGACATAPSRLFSRRPSAAAQASRARPGCVPFLSLSLLRSFLARAELTRPACAVPALHRLAHHLRLGPRLLPHDLANHAPGAASPEPSSRRRRPLQHQLCARRLHLGVAHVRLQLHQCASLHRSPWSSGSS